MNTDSVDTLSSPASLPGPAGERHYKISEIAQTWGMSENTIRRLFDDEPGVLRFGRGSRLVSKKYRRRYFVLCIPESVILRVRETLVHPPERSPGVNSTRSQPAMPLASNVSRQSKRDPVGAGAGLPRVLSLR